MDDILLALVAVYGIVGGVLGAVVARWLLNSCFSRYSADRYAFSAVHFGCVFGCALTAGIAVALHMPDPCVFAGLIGATVAGLIAVVQGAPIDRTRPTV